MTNDEQVSNLFYRKDVRGVTYVVSRKGDAHEVPILVSSQPSEFS
jgi:hypothetical protein